MKVALNSHAVGSALRREAVALRNHLRSKTKRLLSKQRSAPEAAPPAVKSRANSVDGASLRETIRFAQQGDSLAFETVYRMYAGRVYALCLRMLHDPNLAEDALQDTFLQLFRKIQTFRGESAFSTWLHRLTVGNQQRSFALARLSHLREAQVNRVEQGRLALCHALCGLGGTRLLARMTALGSWSK